MIDPFSTAATAPKADIAYREWSAAGQRAAMRYGVNDRTAGPIPTFQRLVRDTAITAQAYAPGADGAGAGRPDIVIDQPADDGYSFADVVDVINPLQHLPVIGTIYRKLTGDTIRPISQIIGGGIFGGPIGAAASTVNAIVKDRTGRDVAENAFALAGFDMTPAPRRPDLTYDRPDPAYASGSPGPELALAADGRRNFAARAYLAGAPAPVRQSWNA